MKEKYTIKQKKNMQTFCYITGPETNFYAI